MLNLDGENIQGILGIMVPIVAIVGGLSIAFAGMYMRNRERMEMISRGMDPSKAGTDWSNFQGRRRRSPLRSGLMWLGAGLGLLCGYAFCHGFITDSHNGEDQFVIYFGFVAAFVGMGSVISHVLEKKEPETPDR